MSTQNNLNRNRIGFLLPKHILTHEELQGVIAELSLQKKSAESLPTVLTVG